MKRCRNFHRYILNIVQTRAAAYFAEKKGRLFDVDNLRFGYFVSIITPIFYQPGQPDQISQATANEHNIQCLQELAILF